MYFVHKIQTNLTGFTAEKNIKKQMSVTDSTVYIKRMLRIKKGCRKHRSQKRLNACLIKYRMMRKEEKKCL
jgi:hypothetical protein